MNSLHKLLLTFKNRALCAGLTCGLLAGLMATAQAQVLPPNPDPTCVVPQSVFNGWFKSGQPSLNGPVNEADSVALNTSNNCNFYQWSEQMFLWLTSPASGPYQGNRVFDSQVFYQVNGNNLVAQIPFRPLNLALRAAQVGPDGLPIVTDAKGHIREFVTASVKAKASLLTDVHAKAPLAVSSVRPGANGVAVFVDTKGKTLPLVPKVTADMLPTTLGRLSHLLPPTRGKALTVTPALRARVADALTAKKVLIKIVTATGPIFVESGSGIVDNLEPGQAGGNGVLVSQQNSVIFYQTIVNDVYAWYLTGRKTPGGISPYYYGCQPIGSCLFQYGNFPTSQSDLQAIESFSQSHGGPAIFPDANALAVEAKLSWVDASTLPNKGQGYVTAQANVPVYNTSNPTNWTPAGTKLATVALVGVHVVGSVNGHPEMVWATFEHQANTPLATYQYTSGGQTVTVNQNTSGTWLFSANGASAPYNAELAQYKSPNIVATTSANIGPSNILREKAWGTASNGQPNQEDLTPAAANTEIISINTNVRTMLNAAGASTDPRYNYLMIGSTWTFGGDQPTGQYPANESPAMQQQYCSSQTCNVIGTSMLANSTMETYHQGGDTTYQTGINCFVCHSDVTANPNVKASTFVSHIFDSLNPLSVMAQSKKAAPKKK